MKQKELFEGCYFKHQSPQETISLIPALHVDENGNGQASIQVITSKNSYSALFPATDFSIDRSGPILRVGNNTFTPKGITLNLHCPQFTLTGHLTYGQLSPLRYDIMGPFVFLPFMECRHSVFSMSHTVNGTLFLNGQALPFNNGNGYIEGDRGSSFPSHYLWTQSHFTDSHQNPCSLMLSIATIPFLHTEFTGIISCLLFEGKEYRFATYLGAHPVEIRQGRALIKQGSYLLIAELLDQPGRTLQAPVQGHMQRSIHENPACWAHYTLLKHGRTLLDFHSQNASFESEYEKDRCPPVSGNA